MRRPNRSRWMFLALSVPALGLLVGLMMVLASVGPATWPANPAPTTAVVHRTTPSSHH